MSSNTAFEGVQKIELLKDLKRVLKSVDVVKIWVENPIITDYPNMLDHLVELLEVFEKYDFNVPELSNKMEEHEEELEQDGKKLGLPCFFGDELVCWFIYDKFKVFELLDLINSFEHFEMLDKYLSNYNYFNYIKQQPETWTYQEFKHYKTGLTTILTKCRSNFYSPQAVKAVKLLEAFYRSKSFKTWWFEVIEDIEKERKEEQEKEKEENYAKFVYNIIFNYINN